MTVSKRPAKLAAMGREPKGLARAAWALGGVAMVVASIAAAQPAEQTVGTTGRLALALTVYSNGLGLVRDRRAIHVTKGRNVLAFEGVSAAMVPESASLSGADIQIVERDFEFDTLTPDALLKRSVGRTVGIVRVHPTTGEETIEKATVLAATDGIVLKTASGRIETGIPGRLIFDTLPEGLRARPTLVATVDSAVKAKREVDLHYLTGGIRWQADYTAELDPSNTQINLEGWATITNTTGAEFKNAALKLVAGEVQRVPRPQPMVEKAAEGMMTARAAPGSADAPRREILGDFYLYSIDRPVTLSDRDTKQVSLLARPKIAVNRAYVSQSGPYAFGRAPSDVVSSNPVVTLTFENAGPGAVPLPEGTVRVYKRDSNGSVQFVGESRVRHTPVGEKVELTLGRAFDVTVQRRQKEFVRPGPPKNAYEASYGIKVSNAREQPVTVRVVESMVGDWQVFEESQPHEKDGRNAAWNVTVPPRGAVDLNYKVRIKQ